MDVSFAKRYQGEADFETVMQLLEVRGFQFVRAMNSHASPKTGEMIEMGALFEAIETWVIHCWARRQ